MTIGIHMSHDVDDFNGHFANYAEYSKTLRSWLVAYGIGGPVLLLVSKDAPAKLATSPNLNVIVSLFVIGVALQILLAFVNKWAAWQMYSGAFDRHREASGDSDCKMHHTTRTYRAWNWINNQSWIDFLVDLGALTSFSIATWMAMKALLWAAPSG